MSMIKYLALVIPFSFLEKIVFLGKTEFESAVTELALIVLVKGCYRIAHTNINIPKIQFECNKKPGEGTFIRLEIVNGTPVQTLAPGVIPNHHL
jgi:hypothetical protein